MGAYFVHSLIFAEKIRALEDACERALPIVQREFGLEITTKQIYSEINVHRENLELVERFRDVNFDRNTSEFMGCESALNKPSEELIILEKELRANGINPDNCSYFPSAICELYKISRLVGEQLELKW